MESDDGHEASSAKTTKSSSKRTRTRVSRACDRCRTKKDKCDGKKPSCSACLSIPGQVCSYDPSTKKRGLPEGYVRGLEKLWALSTGKIKGLEDAVSQLMVDQQHELLAIWNQDPTGEDLHGMWKESKVLHELEGLLSKLESAEPAPSGNQKRKREQEETGSEESNDHLFYRQPSSHVCDGPVCHVASASGSSVKKPPTGFSQHPPQIGVDPATSLPSRTLSLLELYFSHTHCWLPIVERHHILRTSYSYSKATAQTQTSGGDLAALWAILAYTDHQYSRLPATVMPETSNEGVTTEEMYGLARRLIPDEKGLFEIGHVQAMLLLTLVEIGAGHWTRAWILIGHAVRVALDLGLGNRSPQKRGVNVILACFMFDTLIAAHLARSPHLRRADIEAIGYAEEDGLEEWDPWTNSLSSTGGGGRRGPAFTLSCFNRLVDIHVILNDLGCDGTQIRTERQVSSQTRFEQLQALRERLPITSSTLQDAPPHQVYLYLFFLSALLAVHSHSTESERLPPDAFATLSCEILILLTQHAQAPGLGLGVISPYLEYVLHASTNAAFLSRSYFGHNGLPLFSTWARKMAQHCSDLEAIWPVFSHPVLANQRQSANTLTAFQPVQGLTYPRSDSLMTPASAQWSSHHSTDNVSLAPTPPTVASTHDRTASLNGMDNNYRSPHGAERSAHPRNWSIRSQNQMQNLSVTSIAQPSPDHPQMPDLEGFDISMSGLEHTSPMMDNMTMPAGLAMPATDTSPSFHGDDVDAIFHDLAHLDTTEWTNDREQGLKEFGFADDTTFRAFCNDPERMVSSGTPFGEPSDESGTNFWPPPGFFPGHFGESDQQMEASHILHSLSRTEPYPSLPESVGW